MSKLNEVLWKYFLITSVFAFLLHNAEAILYQWRFSVSNLVGYSALVAMLFVPVMLLRAKSNLQQQLQVLLNSEFWWFGLTRRFCLALLALSLAAACFYATSVVWRAGGTCIAYALNHFDQMEKAERVFSVTNGDDDRSFSVESQRSRRPRLNQTAADFERENVVLDDLVARVYGLTSRNMANRSLCHAFRQEIVYENHELAARYYAKAMRLYDFNNESEKALECAAFLVFAQGVAGMTSQLPETLALGQALFAKAGNSDSARENFYRLAAGCREFGMEVPASLTKFAAPLPLSEKSTRYYWEGVAIILSPFVLPYALLWILQAAAVSRSRKKWVQALRFSKSVPEFLIAADKLVVLELASGGRELAESYSCQSIKLVTEWRAN